MIGAEILALVAMLTGAGFSISFVVSRAKLAVALAQERERQLKMMREELHEALEFGTLQALDEFIVVWSHLMSKDELVRLDNLRNDFIIEHDTK